VGGFVCEVAPDGGACTALGGNCAATSCCSPYVCDGNNCVDAGGCATIGENCANASCCDDNLCDISGTNACSQGYCEYSLSGCTINTICCDGPCLVHPGDSFGFCP
jgi:hypothetical protein